MTPFLERWNTLLETGETGTCGMLLFLNGFRSCNFAQCSKAILAVAGIDDRGHVIMLLEQCFIVNNWKNNSMAFSTGQHEVIVTMLAYGMALIPNRQTCPNLALFSNIRAINMEQNKQKWKPKIKKYYLGYPNIKGVELPSRPNRQMVLCECALTFRAKEVWLPYIG